MKTYKFIIAILAIAFAGNAAMHAEDKSAKRDSIENSLTLNKLNAKKEKLEKQIKLETSKRNQQLPGVSPVTMEEINDRQDSICLQLKSELVDVNLEIKELSTDVSTPQLVQQYNQLMQQQVQNSNKPSKTKPTKQPAKPSKDNKPKKQPARKTKR